MVIDTSALLAVFFSEKDGPWVQEQLKKNRTELRMSTVNLTETFILVRERQSQMFESIRKEILESSIRFVAPTIRQAELAAQARLQFPLNLGDCFAYALARDENCPLLTIDPDFKKTDAEVLGP